MLYKNMFWFGLGYLTCKHVAPIARDVVVKTRPKLKEHLDSATVKVDAKLKEELAS